MTSARDTAIDLDTITLNVRPVRMHSFVTSETTTFYDCRQGHHHRVRMEAVGCAWAAHLLSLKQHKTTDQHTRPTREVK